MGFAYDKQIVNVIVSIPQSHTLTVERYTVKPISICQHTRSLGYELEREVTAKNITSLNWFQFYENERPACNVLMAADKPGHLSGWQFLESSFKPKKSFGHMSDHYIRTVHNCQI